VKAIAGVAAAALILAGCDAADPGVVAAPHAASDGPATQGGNPNRHQRGDAAAGRAVFRFETFGNEGFWTDAARLPQGLLAAKLTPRQALESGLQLDIEAIEPDLRKLLEAEAKTDLSPQQAPTLHDPAAMVRLVNANAVVGIVAKDSDGDGRIDILRGDKVGVACTICHTITDKSVLDLKAGGSIGRRVDGPAALTLNVGKLLAMAANSRAFYPNLQQSFLGVSIGRAPSGLGPNSTEAEVDAYLSNPAYYPIGTFDETQDGNGNPVKNTPLFRQDLAAPYGTAGEFRLLDDISNASYTTNLDPTTLLTAEGRRFLEMKAGPAGRQLANEYAKILSDTGVTGFPFVQATLTGKVGDPASPVGRRVDQKKLLDMNAYLDSLPAPTPPQVDSAMAARGREVFSTNCTQCHNVDQSRIVPPQLVPLKSLMPGYSPSSRASGATRSSATSSMQKGPSTTR
jgi:cytochrome c2